MIRFKTGWGWPTAFLAAGITLSGWASAVNIVDPRLGLTLIVLLAIGGIPALIFYGVRRGPLKIRRKRLFVAVISSIFTFIVLLLIIVSNLFSLIRIAARLSSPSDAFFIIAVLSISVPAAILVGRFIYLRIRVFRHAPSKALKFEEYFAGSPTGTGIEATLYRSSYRLLAEQARHRTYAMINLGIGFFLVMVTLVLLSQLYNDIQSTTNAEPTNLIVDCDTIFPSSDPGVRFIESDEAQRIASITKRIDMKNDCLKHVMPTMEAIKKIGDTHSNADQKGLIANLPITVIYGMVARLLLVLLAQTLTYFFLRMYVGNLADARYFANELSNIDLRLSSIQLAMASGDPAIVANLVASLSREDRNPIIRKGRSPIFKSREPELRDLADMIERIRSLGLATPHNTAK